MKFVIFITIALLITFPWLIHSGYLMLLDWPGVPSPSTSLDPTGGIAGLPIQFAWIGLGTLIGSALAQKILILTMLITAGSTTYVFTRYITSRTVASISAGIFAMTNAFVFNRLQMGHLYLLYAYALTPYALYLTLRFIRNPSAKRAMYASITNSIVILLSIHHIILLPLLTGLVVWNFWEKKHYSLRNWTLFLAPYLITTSIILLIAANNPSSPLKEFSALDLSVFSPQAQCTRSLTLDTILLTAQWRNPLATPLPCTHAQIFIFTSITLSILLLIGCWNNKKLALGACIFIVLSKIPFIPAMRDSAKYLADLAIIESILIAYAISYLPKKQVHNFIPFASLLIVIAAGSPMFWGLSNTITPHDYPLSWYAWDKDLASLPEKPTVLFLPWHLYTPFDFSNGKTIANPAQQFFTHANILQGDNLEISRGNILIPSESTNTTSTEIEHVLEHIRASDFSSSLQALLRQQHITYIALAHGSPEEEYYVSRLNQMTFLHTTINSPGLTVWQFGE